MTSSTTTPWPSADTQKPNADGKQSTPTTATAAGKPALPTMNGVAPAGGAAAGAPKTGKPRVEVEQIYNSLREGLGDNWRTYTDAVRSFFRGLTNRVELAEVIDPLLSKTELQRLHNQLFLVVELNSQRDAPDVDVAQWVSHQGKSSTAPKAPTGDAQERRLKREVMSLPARDRRRIKEIPEYNEDMNNTLQANHVARHLKTQDVSTAPASAGLNKNWQTELTNTYSKELAVESGEYMDTESVMARCIPVCYEEGLSSVISEDTARFIQLATDFFVREVVTNLLSRVRIDDGARVIKENTVEHSRTHEPVVTERFGGTLNMEHMRLSMTLGDNLVRQLPLHIYDINSGTNVYDREDELEELYMDAMELDNDERKKRVRVDLGDSEALQLNGTSGAAVDGEDAYGEEVQWANPASIFLLQCLAGH